MPEEAKKEAGIYEEQMNHFQDVRPGRTETHSADDGFSQDLKNGLYSLTARVPSDTGREECIVEWAVEYE
jgi:hypothetical protein